MSTRVKYKRQNCMVFSLEMPFYSLTFLFLLACAVFFYRAGEFGRERSSGWAWTALSILISAAIWGWLHGGLIAVALGQVGLFAGITLCRLWEDPPQ